jgi:hypothetical protein
MVDAPLLRRGEWIVRLAADAGSWQSRSWGLALAIPAGIVTARAKEAVWPRHLTYR